MQYIITVKKVVTVISSEKNTFRIIDIYRQLYKQEGQYILEYVHSSQEAHVVS